MWSSDLAVPPPVPPGRLFSSFRGGGFFFWRRWWRWWICVDRRGSKRWLLVDYLFDARQRLLVVDVRRDDRLLRRVQLLPSVFGVAPVASELEVHLHRHLELHRFASELSHV